MGCPRLPGALLAMWGKPVPSHHFPVSLSLPLDMASQEGKGVEQPLASLMAQPIAVAIGSGDFPEWTQDPLGFLRCDMVFPLPALQSPLGWRTPSQRLPEPSKGQSYPPLSCWKRSAPRWEERLGLQVLRLQMSVCEGKTQSGTVVSSEGSRPMKRLLWTWEGLLPEALCCPPVT